MLFLSVFSPFIMLIYLINFQASSSTSSTPKVNNTPPPAPTQLDTIPEMENLPGVRSYAKKLPPPTLPKPGKKMSKAGPAPAPPPKPKVKTESFQDETCDGSEV